VDALLTVTLLILGPAPGGSPPPGCPEQLARDRLTLVELEPEFVERLYSPALYAAGEVNPAARRVLLPFLESTIERAAGVPDLSVSLDCRTWACRLLVLQPRRSDTSGWQKALDGAAVRERIRTFSISARNRTADTLSGQDLVEATVFLKLADPSGEPRPPGTRPAARPLAPIAPDLCPAEAAAAEKTIAAMRAAMAKALTPAQRFAAEPANEALTREVGALVKRAAASGAPELRSVSLECHGVLCRAHAAAPLPRPAWARLDGRPELDARIVARAYDGDAIWSIRPASTADGREVLARVVRELETRPFFDSCYAQHPARGHLLVSYDLPGDTALGEPGPRGGIEAHYTGSLADSPLGRCLADELGRALTGLTLPENRLHAVHTSRYDWPRPAR
jgi:hypothetical protein